MGTESHGEASERTTIRRVVGLGGFVETAMIALDVYTSSVVFPGVDMARMVGLRVVAIAVCVIAYVAAIELPSLAAVRRFTLGSFITVAALIVLQAREEGGLQSRYLHGVWIVGLYYVTAFPMPWRAGAPRGLAIVATFPVVLGLLALVDPRIAAQWRSGATVGVFGEEYFFVIITVVLAAISSHTTWAARRRIVAEERKQTLQRERAEMAMELHDGVSGALQRALAFLESEDERAPRFVRESIEDGLREARTMTSLLVVPPSTWREVVAVARREMEDTCERAGIAMTFTGSEDDAPISPTIAHDVCRIAREAATNVVRHSRASKVWFTCTLEAGAVRLAIEDDGQGISSTREGRGRGLTILAKRATRHGGDLQVLDRAGGGVRLEARLQLDARAPQDDAAE